MEFSPPEVAAPSPRFGVPLPKGAAPDWRGASADTEAFSIGAPVTFADVNAFYSREMEKKPFGDYAWCGQQADQVSRALIRIWRRAGTSDYLLVTLRNGSPSEPTAIGITQRTGLVVDACTAPAG